MQLAVRPFIADSMPETADRPCRLRNGHSYDGFGLSFSWLPSRSSASRGAGLRRRHASAGALAVGESYISVGIARGIKGAGHGQILADAESPEPGACE
ncbi:MAG: hypothetical protein QOG17_3429 [Gammaproteobacteria bacterium]|nr:hypothetical protein [Gammaproteobacteria bacterium]